MPPEGTLKKRQKERSAIRHPFLGYLAYAVERNPRALPDVVPFGDTYLVSCTSWGSPWLVHAAEGDVVGLEDGMYLDNSDFFSIAVALCNKPDTHSHPRRVYKYVKASRGMSLVYLLHPHLTTGAKERQSRARRRSTRNTNSCGSTECTPKACKASREKVRDRITYYSDLLPLIQPGALNLVRPQEDRTWTTNRAQRYCYGSRYIAQFVARRA